MIGQFAVDVRHDRAPVSQSRERIVSCLMDEPRLRGALLAAQPAQRSVQKGQNEAGR